jgi:hypothetical protein
LAAAMLACGLSSQTITGIAYQPLAHRAVWRQSTAVNYMASYAQEPATVRAAS